MTAVADMTDMSGDAGQDAPLDPDAALASGRALTPAIVRVNERRVARGFWPKLRKAAARIPFAREAVAMYYCARDPATPASAKAMILAALAYFIAPADAIPDVFAGVGYTDDAAVIAAVLVLVGRNLKPRHREAARTFLDRLAGDA
jgi:uncharacterized membrane protein YkvA (DUF1232 family)